MATQLKTVTTTGICKYCKGEFDKAKMTQHLKHCKERAVAIAASVGDGAKQKQRLFHILAEGRYNPQYWMHLEILPRNCFLR
jgi:predicted amidophosphoribosyltransferase